MMKDLPKYSFSGSNQIFLPAELNRTEQLYVNPNPSTFRFDTASLWKEEGGGQGTCADLTMQRIEGKRKHHGRYYGQVTKGGEKLPSLRFVEFLDLANQTPESRGETRHN